MTATATIAAEFKSRMFDVASALWATSQPDLLVSYGRVGINVPEDLVMVLGVQSSFEPGAIATNRQRTETVVLETSWWFFRPGEEGAEREATDTLYARMGELENHLRLTNPRLLRTGEPANGGLDFLTGCQLIEHQFDTTEATGNSGAGRLAVATARWGGDIRIRNN